MFREVVTVCLNPSLDVTVWIDSLDFEEPCFAQKEEIYPGGKGINVSRMLTGLGFSNRSLCVAGEENLSMLRGKLMQESVCAEYLPVKGAAIRENLTLIVGNQRQLKVNRKGPALGRELLEQVRSRLLELCDEATLVVFAGSLPPGVTAEDYEDLIREISSRGIPTAVDTGVFSKEDYQRIRPFVMKPNRVELEQIMGVSLPSLEAVKDAAQELSQWVNHVLVSLGGDGVLYAGEGTCLKTAAPKVSVRSTVGAGDATLSGFLYGLGMGWSQKEAVRFATACGTASVCCDGTCYPAREAIDQMAKQIICQENPTE
ncbi:MAG: 1-phosphofructokinase family hexose kinase [Massiliimalia sp.]|jgi:1-phosphofructokinase family hexose kinase